MSNEEADVILDKYKDDPKVEKIGELNDEMNNKRIDYLVENDLISADEAASWRDNFDHYIPLQRKDIESEGLPNRGSRGFDVRGRPVQVRGGSMLKWTMRICWRTLQLSTPVSLLNLIKIK